MTLFRKFLILFRTLFFFVRSELYIKQAEAIGPRLLVTHIQFPASRSRSLGFGCRSSSAPTPSGHRLSRPPSRPRCLRIVLPAEERVPAPAPRCLQGGRPASRRSAGYNTVSGDASSDKLAAAARKCRWGVLLRAVGRIDGCVLNGVAAVDHDPITDVNADVGHTGGVIRSDEKDEITGLCIRL